MLCPWKTWCGEAGDTGGSVRTRPNETSFNQLQESPPRDLSPAEMQRGDLVRSQEPAIGQGSQEVETASCQTESHIARQELRQSLPVASNQV